MNKFYAWCLKNPQLTAGYQDLLSDISNARKRIDEAKAETEYIFTNKDMPGGVSRHEHSYGMGSLWNVKFNTVDSPRFLTGLYVDGQYEAEEHSNFNTNSFELPELDKTVASIEKLEKKLKKLRKDREDLEYKRTYLSLQLDSARRSIERNSKELTEMEKELFVYTPPEWLNQGRMIDRTNEDVFLEGALDFRVRTLFGRELLNHADFDPYELETYSDLRMLLRRLEPSFEFVMFHSFLAIAKSNSVSFTRYGMSYREAAMNALITYIDNQWDSLIEVAIKERGL